VTIRDVLRALDFSVRDAPVQPELWRRYEQVGAQTRVRVLIRPAPGTQSVIVASLLANVLTDESDLFVVGDQITADVTLAELVGAVLTQSSWRSVILKMVTLPALTAPERAKVFAPILEAIHENRPIPTAVNHNDVEMVWLVARIAVLFGAKADVQFLSVTKQVVAWLDTIPQSKIMIPPTAEGTRPRWERNSIGYVSYDRAVTASVAVSRRTIKVDVAERSFAVDCSDVLWAVVDTGIDASHPAFRTMGPSNATRMQGDRATARDQTRVVRTYDIPRGLAALRTKGVSRFRALADDSEWELFGEAANIASLDEFTGNDHGTHIAGVIGGDLAPWTVVERAESIGYDEIDPNTLRLRGIAPNIALIDVRVFDANGEASELIVITALAFVRWLHRRKQVNGRSIDGVNLSLSVPFAVDSTACGWTPVCTEANRLVREGVVVCAAAGNGGYEGTGDHSLGTGFRSMSITDPGNASEVITVGATHRRDPHRWGPVSRSARGPTADGRHKPDLLAPGHDIVAPVPERDGVDRRPQSGTSQATAHVSGVAALLIARYPELRGQPARVKQILCATATDLGRLPDFQGAGVIDAFRALQHP
jgi:serine protease AprX